MPRALVAAPMLFIIVTSCGVLAYTLQGQAVTVIFDSIPCYGPFLVIGVFGAGRVSPIRNHRDDDDDGRRGASLHIPTLEGFFSTPTLMGRAASINQMAVFVGVLFWSWAWGIWGMLLAVPMMMVVKVA